MILHTLMQAIATQEGYYVPGSRAQRNNNPGNLDFEPWIQHLFNAVLETPEKGETARFARFDTGVDGFSALKTLLLKDYLGLTLADALKKYAPSTENNTIAYLKTVTELTDLTAQTVLTSTNIG